MANYGITFDVTGKSAQQMAEIEKAMQKMGVTAERTTGQVENSVDQLGEHFSKLQERIVEVFALEKIREFGEEVLHVTAEFEGFENRIRFASVNMTDATQNMAFLRDETEKLHLPMRQVYEGFSEMEAGLKGTGVEGARLRALFEGISTASATLHLPEYQLQRTLYDLKEIGEIGFNARIERSLGTALPGIGGIVQETFGKSMKELQKEGISGTDFLNKLGPALKKNFESGLQNYSESLQAKMNDTSNKFLQTQIDLGEKLKPVYMHIMDGLSGALTNVSQMIDYLSKHEEQVKAVGKAIETVVIAMVAYKAITLGVAAAEAIQVAATELMTVANYTAAFGVEGLTYALEQMNFAFGSTAIGVFAASLAVLVQEFMDLNKQAEDALENLTHIKEFSNQFDSSQKHMQDVRAEMAAPNLNDIQRGEILQQIGGYRSETEDQMMKAQGNLVLAQANLKKWVLERSHYKTDDVTKLSPYLQNQASDFVATIKQLQDQVDKFGQTIQDYDKFSKQLIAAGVKKPTYKNLMDPTGDAAMHSTHLSGAEGGLGQAKVINIKIDRVMTVENHDNRNLEKYADIAADHIIRVANNFAESQTGTQ